MYKDRFLRVQLLLLFSGFQTVLVFSTPPYPWGFPHSSISKESACNAGDLGLIPGSGRSLGEGNGSPLQYSCLENPEEPGRLQHIGLKRVRHYRATNTFTFYKLFQEGEKIWFLLFHLDQKQKSPFKRGKITQKSKRKDWGRGVRK